MKQDPFGVRLNDGKDFCHLKRQMFNQCAILPTSVDYFHQDSRNFTIENNFVNSCFL